MSKQKKKNTELADPETRKSMAEEEARFLLWCFGKSGARKHINLNLSRSKPLTENDSYQFWKNVEAAFNTIIAGKVDEIEECIYLLDFVSAMKPRERWVSPLLGSVVFNDFRAQLLTIIEDYKDEWMKRHHVANGGNDKNGKG